MNISEEKSVKELDNEEISKVSGGSNVKEERVYVCHKPNFKHPIALKYGMPDVKKPKKHEGANALLPDSEKTED